jgi:CheY-like chemotaxis protein
MRCRLALEAGEYFFADEFVRRAPGLPIAEFGCVEDDPVKPRVLIVDDERLLADTTAAILRSAGFKTKTAYDGWEALATARSFHPDYLLTDVMMPLMNGIELAIAITKILPSTKILLFSGQAGISDTLQEGYSQGYEFPLLAKPVHPLRLIEALKGNA